MFPLKQQMGCAAGLGHTSKTDALRGRAVLFTRAHRGWFLCQTGIGDFKACLKSPVCTALARRQIFCPICAAAHYTYRRTPAAHLTPSPCLCIQLRQRRSPDKRHLSDGSGHQPPWRHGQGHHRGPGVIQPRRGCQHHFQSVLHRLFLHHGSR